MSFGSSHVDDSSLADRSPVVTFDRIECLLANSEAVGLHGPRETSGFLGMLVKMFVERVLSFESERESLLVLEIFSI